ncbi:hypothetical protein NPIL_501991 [Nephila pilipes]|uniref:Uncharacterized protein n=1 Tax=Nephila pilipes TaxID=299642 RepID=A0A8X6NUN2_NEPPI|nr:hypothetical protein NPIL_501991 [Nephila pilipes]
MLLVSSDKIQLNPQTHPLYNAISALYNPYPTTRPQDNTIRRTERKKKEAIHGMILGGFDYYLAKIGDPQRLNHGKRDVCFGNIYVGYSTSLLSLFFSSAVLIR